jgi:hypothetical protein
VRGFSNLRTSGRHCHPKMDSTLHYSTDLFVCLCRSSACLLLAPLLRRRSPCCGKYQIKCRVVKLAFCRPSLLWGFLPPKGVGWRYAAPGCAQLVLLSARREVVVSGNTQVKMFPSPPLAPILRCELSQIVGGWHTGRRSCDGWGGYPSTLVDPASMLFSCGLFDYGSLQSLYSLCCIFHFRSVLAL